MHNGAFGKSGVYMRETFTDLLIGILTFADCSHVVATYKFRSADFIYFFTKLVNSLPGQSKVKVRMTSIRLAEQLQTFGILTNSG